MNTAASNQLSAAERLDWLRLIRSENVGPITFRALLNRYGSAAAALDALPALAREGGRRRGIAICSKADAEAEIEALSAVGASLVAFCEDDYPAALAAVEDGPPLLSLRGHRHLVRRPAVAVVGARNASANGRRLAQSMAAALAKAELLVASGMARGIDTAAHKGALDGGTAAVLAGGIDVVYPSENQALYDALVSQALVLSEMPPGTKPQARHFPRRNRIISGMALGVVVVEAAPRSGSLITTRLAAEQGREVFAVPGSPLDPRSEGCNALIRDGATLVRSAADVLEALGPLLQRPVAEPDKPAYRDQPPVEQPVGDLAEAREVLAELLGPSAVSVDELVRECQFSAPVVATVLLELELAGRLERQPGGRVALRLGDVSEEP